MKRRRKRLLRGLALALLVLAGWGWSRLRDSSLFYRDTVTAEGVEYHCNTVSRRAFAGEYHWDGDLDRRTISIPDDVAGCRVTALGGFVGRGAPAPFGVIFPEEENPFWSQIVKDRYRGADGALPVTEVVFTLELGASVEELKNIFADNEPYYTVDAEGNDVFYQAVYYVVCAPENRTFHSRDGRLYRRADGTPVTDLPYPAGT